MKFKSTVALAVLALAVPLLAQDNSQHKPKHQQYKLYDVGTFGSCLGGEPDNEHLCGEAAPHFSTLRQVPKIS